MSTSYLKGDGGSPGSSVTYASKRKVHHSTWPLLTVVSPSVRLLDHQQLRGKMVSKRSSTTSLRYGKRKWQSSKRHSACFLYPGRLQAGSRLASMPPTSPTTSYLPSATRKITSGHQRPGNVVEDCQLAEAPNDGAIEVADDSRKRQRREVVICSDRQLCAPTDSAQLFPRGPGDVTQHMSGTSLISLDTLSPRGNGDATRERKAPPPDPILPLVERLLPLGEEHLRCSLPDLRWLFDDGSYPFGSKRGGGGGGGSQPSTTGTQGFPKYATAGPVDLMLGQNLFGYDADDLSGCISWA